MIQPELKELQAAAVIRLSKSPYSSPVVQVKNTDRGIRFCIDYQKLNWRTKPDTYLLPGIDGALHCLLEAKIFATLDFQLGYWQIEMKEEDIEKMALAFTDGLFELLRMLYGLRNAPATLKRALGLLNMGLMWKEFLIYFDEII